MQVSFLPEIYRCRDQSLASFKANMATAVQERFREHVNVVDALRANYSSRDDLNRVSAIQQLEAELSELCSRRETNVQAVVKGGCFVGFMAV